MPEDFGSHPTALKRLLHWWRSRARDGAARGGGPTNGDDSNGHGDGGSSRALIMAPTVGAGFREDGRQLGCVLIHGLSSTPESMRDLGRAMADGGVDVEGVCLAGHCTRPEDLEGVAWTTWYADVRDTIRGMRSRCDRVFVCGQSLGGTLALHAAANEPVDGVITLAAVLYLRDWRLWLLPVLKHVMRWRHSAGNDIAKPGVRDEGSYDRMPVTAIRQLVQLGEIVRGELGRVRVPALIMHGTEDHVAPARNAELIYGSIASKHKEILRLRRSYHVISLDNDFDLVVDRSLRFMRKAGFESTSPS
jgi:carboxylesterase